MIEAIVASPPYLYSYPVSDLTNLDGNALPCRSLEPIIATVNYLCACTNWSSWILIKANINKILMSILLNFIINKYLIIFKSISKNKN